MKKSGIQTNANSDHLLFVVEVDDRIVCYSYPLRGSPSWLHFEQFLREHLKYDQIIVTYKDEDGDDINLNSEEEFQEVLKVYQRINTFLKLNITRIETDAHNERPVIDEEGFPAAVVPPTVQRALAKPDGSGDLVKDERPARERFATETGAKARGNDDDETPPSWFMKYMETFKGDVTAEAARKMMHRMQKFLLKEGVVFQQQASSEGGTAIQAQKRPVSPCSVTSTSANRVVHTGVTCANCNQTIVGVRYKCGNCVKFDLCEVCESFPDIHDKYHVFVKILRPATYAGFKKKTGKMVPLLKHLLYDDTDKATDLRTDREKKLLKRLDKQTHKLEKYREKHRQRKVDREGRIYPSDGLSGHPLNGHTCNLVQLHQHQSHHHRQKHLHRSTSRSREEEQHEPRCRHEPNIAGASVAHKMDSMFLCDETVADGSKMMKGDRFNKTWRLKNSGQSPWNEYTVLKCLWQTVGLRPLSTEVPAPKLMPGENGTITVEFVAPDCCGFYESHWCLFHQGHRFGHKIWCSIETVARDPDPRPELERKVLKKADASGRDVIVADGVEVQEPENGEKERPKEKNDAQHLHHAEADRWADKIKQVVDETAALSLEKDGGEKALRPPYGYATATPNNTPRDLTPPKSPEPGQQESRENLMSELTMALGDKDNAPFLSDAESDISGSLMSLSSTDSDLGYVVVPMPACFNLTVPAVSVNPVPKVEDVPTFNKASEKDENSSVTTATDSDDETTRVPVAKVFRAPDDLNDSDSDDDVSRATLESAGPTQIAPYVPKSESNAKTVEGESGEGVASNAGAGALGNSEVVKGDGDRAMPQSADPASQLEKKKEDAVVYNRRFPPATNDRMVPILPEPIMSAAATVFNSARGILHTFTEASATKPTTPTPTAPAPTTPAPTAPGLLSSPLRQLQDMGFCDRELNMKILAKHGGDVQQTVTELLSLNDNEWFKNRH